MSVEEQAREAFTQVQGPTAAAWLVQRFKSSIHRYGGFEVLVGSKTLMPMWFDVAIAYLKISRRWHVKSERRADGMAYMVFWEKYQYKPECVAVQ